jgi:hypothetical protein
VYQAKKQGKKVVELDFLLVNIFMKKIKYCRYNYRAGDEDLHYPAVEPDNIVHAEGQRKGMPNGKCCYQYEHLFPVAVHVNGRKRSDEENVIKRPDTYNMMPAQAKKKFYIIHIKDSQIILNI